MGEFLLVFLIAFTAFAGFTGLLIFCRRRAARTRHGLTGMCHSTGGTMCASCSESLGTNDQPHLQTEIKPLEKVSPSQ